MSTYLKSVSNHKRDGFHAVFVNGIETRSSNAARFFMMMQDKGKSIEDVFSYIKLGKMLEPDNDWNEIGRIALTFHDGKEAA